MEGGQAETRRAPPGWGEVGTPGVGDPQKPWDRAEEKHGSWIARRSSGLPGGVVHPSASSFVPCLSAFSSSGFSLQASPTLMPPPLRPANGTHSFHGPKGLSAPHSRLSERETGSSFSGTLRAGLSCREGKSWNKT